MPELLRAVASSLRLADVHDVEVGTPPNGVAPFDAGDTTDSQDVVPVTAGQGFDSARTLTDQEMPALLMDLHRLMSEEG